MLDASKSDTNKTYWANAVIGKEIQFTGGKYRTATRFGAGSLPVFFNYPAANKMPPEMIGTKSANDFKSFIPWYRHPRRFNDYTAVRGSSPIGFLDGHVATWAPNQLIAPQAVSTDPPKSTLEVLWSPKDFDMESTTP